MHLILGIAVSIESLNEVAELSGVIEVGNDYLEPDVRLECERVIPEVNIIQPDEAANAYFFLKAHYIQQN